MIYRKHVFICHNQRQPGARVSCGNEHGLALTAEFKRLIKEKGLQVEMRAQRTGCFELCEQGPTVAIYPDAVFYGKVQLSDVEEIVTQHLEQDRIVERLQITSRENL